MLNFNCGRTYQLRQLPFVFFVCLFVSQIKKKLDNTKQPNISISHLSLNKTKLI